LKKIKRAEKQHEKQSLLETLSIDSANWFTLDNINEKLNMELIIPHSVINHNEYYSRLQNLALLVEQGDYAALEKVLEDKDNIEFKNKLLRPLYREIKTIIRYMTYNQFYKLYEQYSKQITQIQKDFVILSSFLVSEYHRTLLNVRIPKLKSTNVMNYFISNSFSLWKRKTNLLKN
jgi:hypothetical protein